MKGGIGDDSNRRRQRDKTVTQSLTTDRVTWTEWADALSAPTADVAEGAAPRPSAKAGGSASCRAGRSGIRARVRGRAPARLWRRLMAQDVFVPSSEVRELGGRVTTSVSPTCLALRERSQTPTPRDTVHGILGKATV